GKRRRDHHSSEELGEGASLSRKLDTHEPGDLAKRFGSSPPPPRKAAEGDPVAITHNISSKRFILALTSAATLFGIVLPACSDDEAALTPTDGGLDGGPGGAPTGGARSTGGARNTGGTRNTGGVSTGGRGNTTGGAANSGGAGGQTSGGATNTGGAT